MADAIKATPRNQPLGSMLDFYNANINPLLNKYALRDVLPLRPSVDPIIGGATLGDLGPNQLRDIATEMSYGNYQPFRNTRNIQTATLDPTTFDALTMLPFGAGAAKVAKPVAQAAGRTAAKAAVNKMVDLEQKYGLPTSPMMSVVKPEGGQWESTGAERLGRELKNMSDNKDVSNWLQTTGRKYIMNRSGTPKDEIRLLADQGITHLSPAELRGGFEQTDRMLMKDVVNERKKAGYPGIGLAETDLGRRWELRADAMIQPNKAEDFLYSDAAKADMPWLEKIDPQTPVYGHMLSDAPEYLGMDKIANALSNEIDAGRLRPEQLNKVSMGQAVKLADEQRLAAQAAQAEGLQTIPTVREYPEGFAWKELTNEDPKMLDAILKREGEIMQNCVGDGGYCDDVIEGGTRLFSLRDKAGNPHVTIEVNPKPVVFSDVQKLVGPEEADRLLEGNTIKEIVEMYPELRQFNIKQVKGKQNEAPISDYIPYVQDFVMNPVTGSPFNKVGDLANTNLVDLERLRKHGLFDLYVPGSGREIDKELRRIYPPMTGSMGGEMLSGEFGVRIPSYEMLRNVVQDLPGNYASPSNLVDYLKTIEPKPIEQGFSNFTPGFAAGGLIDMDGIDPDEAYEFIDYGTRETGENKEAGALGEIRMPDGQDVMTEYSINVDGKEMPSIIEGMHPADINYIRETGEVPEDAARTAMHNARKREAQGKSPFYNRKEDKGFAEGGQYNDPFADMPMLDKIALLARGAKKRYIDNFTASNQHGQYPEQLAAGLKDKYFVELGNLRKNRGPLDVAINYGGGYDFAANRNVPPQDVRDMAKAYQLFDYMTSMKDTAKADAVSDYYENMAGVEAGLAGRGRGRMAEDDLQRMAAKYGMSKATQAPAFVEQKYAEGGLVYNDYDEMFEFR